jgi:hypothetical protein
VGRTSEPDRPTPAEREEQQAEDLTRLLLIALGVLVGVALVIVVVVAVRRRLARHHELAQRAWALVLVDRLEAEGAERGRRRRRNEAISHYAAALGDDALAHPRLAEVGLVISAAIFAPVPPSDASGVWAAHVIDEAVAAHPVPSRADERRDRREQKRAAKDGDLPVGAGTRRL